MLVTILNGSVEIESRPCREVRLPDGRTGVVWRGLAYALTADGASIDAASDGVAPALCGSIAVEPTSTAYAVIEGTTETYVLVAGSVVERERTTAMLAAGGLTVIRSGRYLGEVVDGLAADWFVRVATPPGGSDALREIIDAKLGLPAPVPTAEFRLRVALLAADLTSARAREAHDRAEIDRLRAALADRAANDGELTALQAAFDDGRRAIEALEAEAAAPIATSPTAPLTSPRLAKRLGEEIGDVMSTLLPRVVLVRDSETLIAAEFSNRRRLYAALLELEQADVDVHPKWKALQGAGKWIERHVSNGQDDAGRIYARRRSDNRKWDVLVSHKGEQSRDIAWLRERH